MSFLFATDLHRWDQIAGKWELEEHRHRTKVSTHREAEIEQLRRVCDQEDFEAERLSLLSYWGIDPIERPRDWTVWWEASDL